MFDLSSHSPLKDLHPKKLFSQFQVLWNNSLLVVSLLLQVSAMNTKVTRVIKKYSQKHQMTTCLFNHLLRNSINKHRLADGYSMNIPRRSETTASSTPLFILRSRTVYLVPGKPRQHTYLEYSSLSYLTNKNQ